MFATSVNQIFLEPGGPGCGADPRFSETFSGGGWMPTFVADCSFEFGVYDSDLKECVIGVDGEDGIVIDVIDDCGRLPPSFQRAVSEV